MIGSRVSKFIQLSLFIMVAILASYETQHRYEFLGIAVIGIVKTVIEVWMDRKKAT